LAIELATPVTPPVSPQPAYGEQQGDPGASVGYAVGVPGVLRPGSAVRISTYPVPILRLGNGYVAEAGEPLLAEDFLVPAPGVMRISVVVTQNPTVLQVTWDGMQYWSLSSTNLPLGVVYRNQWEVVEGDRVNLTVTEDTTFGMLRLVYVPSV